MPLLRVKWTATVPIHEGWLWSSGEKKRGEGVGQVREGKLARGKLLSFLFLAG
jgi:hypothetical protein